MGGSSNVVNVRIFDKRFVRLYRETGRLVKYVIQREELAIELARKVADMLYEAKLVDAKERERIFAELVMHFSKIQTDFYNRGCSTSAIVKFCTALLRYILETIAKKFQGLANRKNKSCSFR